MDDQLSAPPVGLLRRLATGDVDDDDFALLEAMLRAEGLAECPPWVQARASRLARAGRQDSLPAAEAFRRVTRLARLVFDSWSAPRPALLRGQGSTQRQLLLRAEDVEVSLHVQEAAAFRLSIIGQALGMASGVDGEALLVTATARQTPEEPAGPAYGPVPLDAYGEFAFPHVAPGRYVLSLQFGEQRVDSEALALGVDDAAGPADAAS
jgi:hypothetical protein